MNPKAQHHTPLYQMAIFKESVYYTTASTKEIEPGPILCNIFYNQFILNFTTFFYKRSMDEARGKLKWLCGEDDDNAAWFPASNWKSFNGNMERKFVCEKNLA